LEKKKRDEADQLKKTHKVTSFFSVLKNDATGAQARSPVSRFGGAQYIFRGARFLFLLYV